MLYIIYIFKIRNFGLKLKSFRNHGVILGLYFYLYNLTKQKQQNFGHNTSLH